MRSFSLKMLILMVVCVGWLAAIDVRDESFVDQREVAGQVLDVRGTHYYVWGFWDIEICVLYAPQQVDNESLLDGMHPLALEVHYLRDFEREDMIEATVEGVAKALDRETDDLGPIRAPLDAFNAAYRAVKEGERLVYVYEPEVGIRLVSGDETLVTINDRDLAMAIFGIWIGERPFSKKMRKGLLGLDGETKRLPLR